MICETEKISDLFLQEAIAEETERRRLHRKPFLREATIVRLDGRPVTAPVFCRDISRDGIGLLHEGPLNAGARFALNIPIIGRVLAIQCEVNWCEQVGEQQFFSGNAYHYVTTPQSLVLLSAALSQQLNRRLHQRYPFVRPVKLEDTDGNSLTGFCRDISSLGIGLIHRKSVTPGRVALSLRSAENGDVDATVDIRRCTSIGQGWYASGGTFSLEDPED